MAYQGTALWREPEGPCLRNFNERKAVDSVNGALALRPQIERIVDQLWEEGFDGIWYMGIGGTWALGAAGGGVPAGQDRPACVRGKRRRVPHHREPAVYQPVGAGVLLVSGNTKEMVELVGQGKRPWAPGWSPLSTPPARPSPSRESGTT